MIARLAATLFAFVFLPAAAEAAPGYYDLNPLTQTDINFYYSVKRPGADCVTQATGADKAAIDAMRKNHGVLPMTAMPEIKGNPTAAQLAALQANMGAISAQATKNGDIQGRAARLSMCDENLARKHNVYPKYVAVKGVIEAIVNPMGFEGGSCGGDDCAPDAHPTAAEKALWKKEADVGIANRALLKPHQAEIQKLEKIMLSAMGQ